MAPEYFGHYTSGPALLNIVESCTLWATNIKFLNDEHEFLHAIDLAKQVINRSKTKVSENESRYIEYQKFVKQTLEVLDSLDEFDSDSIFTVSFSEKKDLLSQWRGYCQSNLGYCISLDTKALLNKVKEKFIDAYFYKCIYDKDEKDGQLSELLNTHWSAYFKAKNEEEKQKEIDVLMRKMVLLASHFKHPSFQEEQEHRLVINLKYSFTEVKFRTSAFSIVPYIEIPMPVEIIKAIHIGPTSNIQLAKRGLEALLNKAFSPPYFLNDIRIFESSIPYRS